MELNAPVKKARSRRPLKDLSANDVNISKAAPSPSPLIIAVDKENLSILSPSKNTKKKSVSKATDRSLADELQDMQRRLQKLSLEKEKTEELLRQRDEALKQKEEELENRGKEQERLQKELKKLQKLKEFKPTMSVPSVKSLREKEEEKKKNIKKKKNGEKKIKKPCPPYTLWCKDQWNEVKKEKPEADFKEISTILGARWKNVSAEEKKPYEEKYKQEKEAYLLVVGQEKRENEAMRLLEEEQKQKTAMDLLEQYLQFKEEADQEGGKKRKEKDPLKPKRPMSAFFLFSKDRRTAMVEENKNATEIAKIAGEEWKNLPDEEKAPYEEIAKKHMEEYNRDMELYKQKKLEESLSIEKEEDEQKKVLKQEALQLLKKKEKTENIIKKTKEIRLMKKKQNEGQNSGINKPKKPASSFLLFSKEARKQLMQERPNIANSTLSAMISVKWKELSETEKQIWNDQAGEAMAAYKKEMEEYKKLVATSDNVTLEHESTSV